MEERESIRVLRALWIVGEERSCTFAIILPKKEEATKGIQRFLPHPTEREETEHGFRFIRFFQEQRSGEEFANHRNIAPGREIILTCECQRLLIQTLCICKVSGGKRAIGL